MNSYQCFLCESIFSEIRIAIQHLRNAHNIKEKVSVIKCIAGNVACIKTFQTWSGLKKHVEKCIKDVRENSVEESVNSSASVDECVSFCPEEQADVIESCSIIPLVYENSDCDFSASNDNSDNNEGITPDLHTRIIEHVESFTRKIAELETTEKVKNGFYNLVEDLLAESHAFKCNLIKQTTGADENILEVLEVAHDTVLNEILKHNTVYKRNKICEKNELYVKPEERAIGTHWATRRDSDMKQIYPLHVQSIFQYVPITKTLQSLFSREDFKKLYFEYNNASTGIKHTCTEGNFKDFCCGDIYKNNDLFRNYPESIQIQLFTDGFEMCNALKSKANLHSQVSFYFAIRNLPHEFAYNLNNIHLVALCNANDLKSEQVDYNNIWKTIVEDLSNLENTGIEIGAVRLRGKFDRADYGHMFTLSRRKK